MCRPLHKHSFPYLSACFSQLHTLGPPEFGVGLFINTLLPFTTCYFSACRSQLHARGHKLCAGPFVNTLLHHITCLSLSASCSGPQVMCKPHRKYSFTSHHLLLVALTSPACCCLELCAGPIINTLLHHITFLLVALSFMLWASSYMQAPSSILFYIKSAFCL